jgi:NlpC/P60 family putative phage cell wall peptidase
MTEIDQRNAVVAEARSWALTPYRHCADIKGVGVDCGMLIVRVFVDLGLVEPFDPRPYAIDFMMHRDEERYLGWVKTWCAEVETPRPGDLALYRFGRCFSHGGIVVNADPLTIVHAYRDSGMVCEDNVGQNPRLSDPARKPLFFSYWAKSGRADN